MKSFFYYFTLFCSIGTMVLVTVKPQAVRDAGVSFGKICGQIAETLKPEENTAVAETKNKEEQLADFLADSPYNRRQTADGRQQDNEKAENVSLPIVNPIKNTNFKIADKPLIDNEHITERVVPANYQEEITESKQQKKPSPIRFASVSEEIRNPAAADVRAENVQPNYNETDNIADNKSGLALSPFSTMAVQPIQTPAAPNYTYPVFAQPVLPQTVSNGGLTPPAPAAKPQPAYSSVYQQPIQTASAVNNVLSPQPAPQQPPISQHPLPLQYPAPSNGDVIPPHPSQNQFAIQPAVIAETVPCHGTETVARVGTQVILMCDILPQLRRVGLKQYNEQLAKLSEEEQKKIPEDEKEKFIEMFIAQLYPQFLKEQISVMLIYNDFIMSKNKEEVEFYMKNLGQEFDEEDIPAMMKEFGVNDLAALKTYLNKELGSSLERERLLTSQSRIAQQWLMNSVRTAEGECTHTEMMDYYTSHQPEFETKAKVKYRELTVNFANHKTKLDAWKKIVWMGNETARGVPFDEMAKVNSEGFTASKGGLWDWISKESITSKELEKVLFTQPVGMVNPPVIETAAGLHIIQVLEREENRLTPFIEAQVKIREKIKQQRRQKYQEEYLDELNRKFPSIVLREQIDFKITQRAVQAVNPVRVQ